MAKKLNAKERRMAAAAQKMNSIKEKEAERKQKELEEARLREKKMQAEQLKKRSDERLAIPKSKRKSLAKAVGLKSTFAVGGDIYMTSFGKGNAALLEKKISGSTVDKISESELFEVDESGITKQNIPVVSKRIRELSSQADSPIYRSGEPSGIQQDNLMLKSRLEELYFGRVFDDNIHIQIIYNILDIEKILTAHSVNTMYTLNNLLRVEFSSDFFLNLNTTKPYDKFASDEKLKKTFLEKFNMPTLGYYGSAFFAGKDKKRPEQQVFDILALIANLRHWCVHCEQNKRTWLYNMESYLDSEFLETLDSVYDSALHSTNDTFIEDNKVNLIILAKDIYGLTPADTEKMNELVRLYYDFMVRKEQKNLGFSLTKLRECMLSDTEIVSREPEYTQKYDSVRSKLYKIIDFMLFRAFTTDSGEQQSADNLVTLLRGSFSETEKERIYKEEGERLWKKYGGIITGTICHAVTNPAALKAYKTDAMFGTVDFERIVKRETGEVSYFSKMMYLLSLFIDGKEINDLTTGLINKLDNIASLLSVAKEISPDSGFVGEYGFFADSKKLVSEMRIVKNLARKNGYEQKVKKQMYIDAMHILGINKTELEIERDLNTFLGMDENGNPDKSAPKDFRNFIIKNVIESSRFRYLVKYCKPETIRSITKRRNVIEFVLKQIPDTQIERYYFSCNPNVPRTKYVGRDTAINELTDVIFEMSFEKFKDVKQKTESQEENERKMKYQAVISLYLTISYLFVKNLVNINARYVMAFHSLERDVVLYNAIPAEGNSVEEQDKKREAALKADYAQLTKMLLGESAETAGNRYLRNKKWHELTRVNLGNYNKDMTAQFRNTVAHLNPIRNADNLLEGIGEISSYYAAYHYIYQRSVIARTKKSDIAQKYTDALDRYKTYNKDLVKALCVPFAYNLVRFKALSIYEMFDRNYAAEDGKTEKDTQLVRNA